MELDKKSDEYVSFRKQLNGTIERVAENLIKLLGKDKVKKKTSKLYFIHTNLFYNSINTELAVYLSEEESGLFFTDLRRNIDELGININDWSQQNRNTLNEALQYHDVSFVNCSFYTEANLGFELDGLTRLVTVLLMLNTLDNINVE